MMDLPRKQVRRVPKQKTALNGAASRKTYKGSSRPRGWGGSGIKSSDAHVTHHECVDLSGCIESQDLFRVFCAAMLTTANVTLYPDVILTAFHGEMTPAT